MRSSGVLRQAQGALHVPAPRPQGTTSAMTRRWCFDLLQQEKLPLVQAKYFNWPAPDHFPPGVPAPEEELEEAIGRLARFLKGYKQ